MIPRKLSILFLMHSLSFSDRVIKMMRMNIAYAISTSALPGTGNSFTFVSYLLLIGCIIAFTNTESLCKVHKNICPKSVLFLAL